MIIQSIPDADVREHATSARRVGFARPYVPCAWTLGVFAAWLVYMERNAASMPFVAGCFAVLAALILIVTRRPMFAALAAAGTMALTTLGSVAKFKWMTINAHVFDIWFYVARPETFVFLAGAFPRLLVSALLLALIALAAAIWLFRVERPHAGMRRNGVLALLISAGTLPITLPHDATDFNYHINGRHFASSFFASFADLARFSESDPFSLPFGAAAAFEAVPGCPMTSAPPDIMLTLSESAVPPAQVPGWTFDPAINERFKSFDGRVHKARVETIAGGTWVSYASILSGISMADFGWKRPYASMLLKDGLNHSLASVLARCGYRTVALSPGWFRFVNEGPFLQRLGFQEYYDAKALGAPDARQMDSFYFGKALEIYKDHIAKDRRPLFLFVMSTVAHSPYTYRAAPERRIAGEPFGNDAATDEYLRRLTLAQDDYAEHLAKLKALRRPVIAVQFGDHHPVVTREALARAGQTVDPTDWTSPLYETFYAVTPLNAVAKSRLPDVPALDLAYLGLTLLDVAGLPLDAVMTEKRILRDRCAGAFHTCADRTLVDAHLARLRRSGLLGSLPDVVGRSH